MASIDWSAITVGEPEDYSDKYQTRNQEKFFHTLLQMLQQMQSLDFQIADVTTVEVNTGNITIDLSGVEQAIRDLAQENILIDLGAVRIEIYGKTLSIEE
jgi:phage-related protein